MNKIDLAYEMACKYHTGLFDKSNKDYINHPISIAAKLKGKVHKKLFGMLIMLMFFLLAGCSHDSKYYLKQIGDKDSIKYLSDVDVLFFYKNISGFDSSGILYFLLEFEESPTEFLSQFENKKDESEIFCGKGKNESFEEKVNTLISSHFKKDYLQFEEQYQINWDLDYIFINDTPNSVTLPMIYFEDSFQLIIIKLVM